MFLGDNMTDIVEIIYNRIKEIVSDWDDNGIYAISFFVYSNEDFQYSGFENVSSLAVSYNTEDFCDGAGKYDEERWNYAFWSQDETSVIDPLEPNRITDALFDWYNENGITDIGYESEEDEYDENGEYVGKGPVGHYELVNIAAEVANRLQSEGFIKNKFGNSIPIIVHGLEYVWYDIEATKKANPNNEAKDFLQAVKMGNV